MAQSPLGNAWQVINSSIIGVAKPAKGFYDAMLEHANVAARVALFVDDSLKNCQVAQALGIHAVHHQHSEDTMQRVQQFMQG